MSIDLKALQLQLQQLIVQQLSSILGDGLSPQYTLRHITLNIASQPSGLNILSSGDMRGFTCYARPFLSFRMYAMPFDKYIWCIIPLYVIVLTLIVVIYLYWTQHFFSCLVLSFLVGALLEDFCCLPRKMWKLKFVKCVLTPWLFAVVILSNCYTGIVISEVNSLSRMSGCNHSKKFLVLATYLKITGLG